MRHHVCAGYTETTGPAGQVMIDSMQDPAAAELGLPGEDEGADPPEDDLAGYPETFEELDAQQDQAEADIENITVSTAKLQNPGCILHSTRASMHTRTHACAGSPWRNIQMK